METPATVAVVGLGPLGLVTLKNLVEEGLDATGFDMADVVGGLWNFSDEGDQTTVLESENGFSLPHRVEHLEAACKWRHGIFPTGAGATNSLQEKPFIKPDPMYCYWTNTRRLCRPALPTFPFPKASTLPTFFAPDQTAACRNSNHGCLALLTYHDTAAESTDTPTYPEARHVQKYLCDYAEHFGLGPRMRLGTEVLAVEHDETSGRWRVETAAVMGGAAASGSSGTGKTTTARTTEERWFNKVVFATGINKAPVTPQVEGIERFEGEVLHSSGYKRQA
ncbi:flavin-containing monooxygenase 2 [Purpureocillium lilacinum]|uniref:Flavin-containing monooxygenase 2 n=1 Tax=Purpureocillium lilacinum TaxID=33203 RepID=A0A2U3EDD6_PURLI|nr:flavin-containing monooxygenase 2 [Purpureocillium lilacinum]